LVANLCECEDNFISFFPHKLVSSVCTPCQIAFTCHCVSLWFLPEFMNFFPLMYHCSKRLPAELTKPCFRRRFLAIHLYYYLYHHPLSQVFSSWYFSWTSGDPHRWGSGFKFHTAVLSYYVWCSKYSCLL